MGVSNLLLFLAYLVLTIIIIIFLAILFPLHASFLSTVDGFHYDAEMNLGVILGMLSASIGFSPEGGSFELLVFSFPIYDTQWVELEKEPAEEPVETENGRSKKGFIKLYEPIRRLLNSLLRIIDFRRLDINMTAGLSDPYVSGMIFGVVYPVIEMTEMAVPQLSFSLTPVFVEERFYSDVRGNISLRIIRILAPLLRFFLSKEYREYRRS